MEQKKKILTFKSALLYGFGIFGIQMLIGMLNSYQSQFYTSILGAELTKCAVIILAAKVISSFSDPIIGSIIDRSKFKSGKMKPFVAMSILPFAIITTLMFIKIDFPNDVLKYGYITLTSVLWNIAMSFADIPSQGMLALLSPDSDEKSMAAGISNTMKSIAVAAPTVIIPVVCVLTGSATIGEKEYLITAAIIGVLAVVLVGLMLKTSKEVVESKPVDASFKAMFSELRHNRMLLLTFLVYILGFGRNIAMSIAIQASAVLVHEVTIPIGQGITLAGENLSVLLGIGSGITSMISIVLAPVVNKKLGTKKTYLAFGIYGTVVSVLCFSLYVFAGSIFRTIPALIIMQFFIGFMFGTHGYTPMIMLSDTVDYTEMTTGKRTEGVQYAVLSLGVKLSNAFSVAVGVFVVGLSGYVGTMTYADVTPSMQNIVMVAYWLLPGICTFLSCIPVCFYKIDGELREQVMAFMAKKQLKETETIEK